MYPEVLVVDKLPSSEVVLLYIIHIVEFKPDGYELIPLVTLSVSFTLNTSQTILFGLITAASKTNDPIVFALDIKYCNIGSLQIWPVSYVGVVVVGWFSVLYEEPE